MEKFTWDDLYERADGAAFGDPELTAKDEARYQVREMMLDNVEEDPELEEIPEDFIGDYCIKLQIRFDDRGNIIEPAA